MGIEGVVEGGGYRCRRRASRAFYEGRRVERAGLDAGETIGVVGTGGAGVSVCKRFDGAWHGGA